MSTSHSIKAQLLTTFERLNRQKLSNMTFDMSSPIEDLRAELEYIRHKKQTQDSINQWKEGLMLLATALVYINNKTSTDVCLDDWLVEVKWQIYEEGKYDQVFE